MVAGQLQERQPREEWAWAAGQQPEVRFGTEVLHGRVQMHQYHQEGYCETEVLHGRVHMHPVVEQVQGQVHGRVHGRSGCQVSWELCP